VTRSDHPDSSGPSGAGASNLALRVASVAVLAPVVLGATFADGWIFLALCTIGAGGILWEWTALVAQRADPRILAPGLAALLLSVVLAGLRWSALAFGAIAIGSVLAAIAVRVRPGHDGGPRTPSRSLWAGGGVIYAGAGLLGPALMRGDPQWGLTALLFLFGIVWNTDIFAYLCGRAIGGRLLWPEVSPKKTWSGAAGGLMGGVVAGLAVAYASGVGKLWIVGIMALMFSVLAQVGDLFESAVKRRFGAKDASHLIPGHGGLMDRLDGFLVAAFAALLVAIVRQGTAAPGRGLLIW
jgi:phosphatidate cytidylyltransferase